MNWADQTRSPMMLAVFGGVREMATNRRLDEDIASTIRDWVISRLPPLAPKPSDQEREINASIGLVLCILAVTAEMDEPVASTLFVQGAFLLELMQYSPLLPDYRKLRNLRAVRRNPVWRWHANGVLLRFRATACDALMDSVRLPLPANEYLRDRMVVDLLDGTAQEIPVSQNCIHKLAEAVSTGEAVFCEAKLRRRACKLAGQLLAGK